MIWPINTTSRFTPRKTWKRAASASCSSTWSSNSYSRRTNARPQKKRILSRTNTWSISWCLTTWISPEKYRINSREYCSELFVTCTRPWSVCSRISLRKQCRVCGNCIRRLFSVRLWVNTGWKTLCFRLCETMSLTSNFWLCTII